MYVFLAIICVPSVILSIIFACLAFQAYKSNCKLEENALENPENSNQDNQDNAKNDESKTKDNEISENSELNAKKPKPEPKQENNVDEKLKDI